MRRTVYWPMQDRKRRVGLRSNEHIMMIQKQRENLFAMIRGYHEAPVLLEPSNAEMGVFIRDLERMKDKIISMTLGLVRGSEDFKDWSSELNALAVRVKPKAAHTNTEKKERELVSEKIGQLLVVVEMTQKAI